MQTIEVSVDKQKTQDFDEDDVLEEFIERVQHRAAEPDSPRVFVVPLPKLFGLSVDDGEKCVVILLENMSPRYIKFRSDYLSADVQTMRDGRSAACLFLAEGRVIVSEKIIREVWPADYDRLIVLWLFRNSNAKLYEYFYHDDINQEFSTACEIAECLNEARDEAEGEKTALVFDSFQTLGDTEE
ncbi:hypothetical protein [Paraburkholderia aspalathi]|uniref:Uncharacterized protein n=1 Tax=Paraburkholderia aspalathi TaxID=1324617 RepID=A0A1I7EPQ2_9BURK|nr:hypothetical protein [Paraburkholderia aspalathi]SFU25867.1 hypothetical protein SAMN05192563_10432 [Paraburkholderia aspalathi]